MIRNRNLVPNEVMRTTILWTAGYYSFQDRLLSVFCIRYLINLDVHALKIKSAVSRTTMQVSHCTRSEIVLPSMF
jgi:hypothetical protein